MKKINKTSCFVVFFSAITGLSIANSNPPNKKSSSIFFNTPEYITLDIDSGLNEDVIANGTGATDESTTSDIDGTGYCFLEQGLVTSTGNAPTTYGLNPGGYYDLSNDNEGAIYQFADYSENNALRLSNATTMSGTLTFSNPDSFQNLYILATSGGANTNIDVQINFDDNTSQTVTNKLVPDWYYNTNPPAVISGIGRVNRNDDGLQNEFNNPRIYHITLTIDEANYSKTVESVTITKTNTNGFLNVFAVTGKTSAACLQPTNLAINDITTNSAEVTWDLGDTETAWEVAIQESGITAPDSGSEVATQSYEFDNLLSNTEYTIYVRAYCGTEGNYSFWSTITFTTACDTATGLNESFEGSSNIPNCWEIINDGDSNYPWEVYTFSGHTGNNSVRIESDWNSHDDYLITPNYSVVANQNDLLSFWARNGSSFQTQPFDVVVSTTGNAKEDFIDVIATNINPSTSWTEYSYDLSAYAGQNIYVAFKNTSLSGYQNYYLYIDDVQTTAVPLCAAPTNLDAPVVNYYDAQLSWDAGEANAWEVAVQPVGSGEPESGVAVITNEYTATLEAETVYEYYVRVNCDGVEGFSPWAGPYVFGVYAKMEPTGGLTDDVIANGIGTPYSSTTNNLDGGGYVYMSEDYQYDANTAPVGASGDGLPANGDLTKEGAELSGLHYQMSPFDTPYAGNNSLRLENIDDEGTITYANTQLAQTLYLMVTSGGGSANMTGTITFEDASTQIISSTAVPDWYNNETPPVIIRGIGRVNLDSEDVDSSTNNPRVYELEIPIDITNQTKSIASITIQKESGNGVVNIFGSSIKLAAPAEVCDTPSEIVVENITDTTAEISWTANGDETEWEVVYGFEGFDPETEGTTIEDNDGTLGVTLTDLDPETVYDVYVYAVCNNNEMSDISSVESFTTMPEPPANDDLCDAIALTLDAECSGDAYTNVGATLQTDEPLADCYIDGSLENTVWFSFVAPENGGAIITTDFAPAEINDSQITIYAVTDCSDMSSLTEVACNDDNPNDFFTFMSYVQATDLTANETYYIQVDGYNGAQGGFCIEVQSVPDPPVNDDLCNAIALNIDEGCTGDLYTNSAATLETDEPLADCFIDSTLENTVWFSFVAPANGSANITTDIDPAELNDSQIAVYTVGDCSDMNTLTLVACDDDGGNANTLMSIIELTDLTANETYYIQVDGYSGAQGGFCIEVNSAPCEIPSDIIVDNVTDTSAEVSWTANGDETEWLVVYGPEDFDPETEGTSITDNDGTLGVTLSDLDPNTVYDVYVYAVCDETTMSEISESETFTTEDLGVDSNEFANFKYYPNPVNNILNVSSTNMIDQVEIYNLLGQKIIQQEIKDFSAEINLSNIQEGSYLMVVKINESKKSIRLIKVN
ncbi:fibronectin type III domain-containing protein [Mesonia sp.]|uniref:fibronectin type III domain-containing protein n=1 Tax=Mesonia sp. TaxID=1960830 RepID=UPI0025C46C65|nr:fibronectin type III domain-containing protein [Mesonia sp.]